MRKEVNAGALIKDITQGLDDLIVMQNHHLEPHEYLVILQKLRDVHALDEQEVLRRLASLLSVNGGFQPRQAPRCYLLVPVEMHAVDAPEIGGPVEDLSEKGFRIGGMALQSGEEMEFTVQVENLESYVGPFSVFAQCKWTRNDLATGIPSSGFEITQVSEKDMEALRKLIELIAVCGQQ